jgi:hypothetical protein
VYAVNAGWALFIIDVFKNKINSRSVVRTVGLRIPTKQIKDFSTFNVSNISRQGASQLQTKSADFWTFSANIFLEDIFSFA